MHCCTFFCVLFHLISHLKRQSLQLRLPRKCLLRYYLHNAESVAYRGPDTVWQLQPSSYHQQRYSSWNEPKDHFHGRHFVLAGKAQVYLITLTMTLYYLGSGKPHHWSTMHDSRVLVLTSKYKEATIPVILSTGVSQSAMRSKVYWRSKYIYKKYAFGTYTVVKARHYQANICNSLLFIFVCFRL